MQLTGVGSVVSTCEWPASILSLVARNPDPAPEPRDPARAKKVKLSHPLFEGGVEIERRPKKGPTTSASLVAKKATSGDAGVWGDILHLVSSDSALGKLSQGLRESLAHSRAPATFKVYAPLVAKWENFCLEHGGKESFPASVALLLLYLQERLEEAQSKGYRESHVSSALYAVDFVHRMRGFPLVGREEVVLLLVDAAKRLLGRPVQKKRALGKEVIRGVRTKLLPSLENPDLLKLRTILFLMLSFVLTARWDDLSRVCPDHILDYGSHIVVFIEDSKTDGVREGAFTPIVDSGDPFGACALLRLWLSLIPPGTGSVSLWRRVNRGARGPERGQYLRAEALAYSSMWKDISKSLVRLNLRASCCRVGVRGDR